ncbi:Protease 3 precursor [Planctomycetes bacterium Pan216]|uniref:Protease 3 n=1 Tax=Kolteria novifilia TaxID=2527975 RepID=A0A518BB26_9BACT|nr:Protease 3 precursor [Planctomycetes bacterium Pan216]
MSNILEFALDRYRLGNGLEVVLHQDRAIPIVAVNLWYHVGSKNESPTLTGLAHLFEHLMFEGSAGYDDEYFKPLQEAGGSINGSTSNDRTNYYEVVPSNFLERALWMEADRMGRLLPVLSEAKLENQRSVVQNERRQRIDNQPYGRASEVMAKQLYPDDHPYSWPVIGWMEHIEAATLQDAKDFFETYYRPSNASLVVAGDFEAPTTKDWIERYFGGIPDGSKPPIQEVIESPLDGSRSTELEDRVALPRLDLAWPGITRFHADEPALDFAAQVLAGRSKDSRLKRILDRERRLISTIGAYNATLKLTGQFGIRAYALPGKSLDEIEVVIREQIAELASTPPTEDEMTRIRNFYANQAYARIETLLGRADAFNHYLFYAGDLHARSFIVELDAYQTVTAEDVQRVTASYLNGPYASVRVLPQGGQAKAAREVTEDRSGTHVPKKKGHHDHLPDAGPDPDFRAPAIERATASCGLDLLFVRWPRLPRIDYLLLMRAGSSHDVADKSGLARLTSELLDEGTVRHQGLGLVRKLDHLGATLQSSMGVESGSLSLRCLREMRHESFALLAEVLRQPMLAEDDFERERGRLLAEIAYREEQPAYLADEAIDEAIFGSDHPYGRCCDGREEDLRRIGRADVVDFFERRYRPDGATLLVVGDTTLAEVMEMVEHHFADWKQRGSTDMPTPFERPDVNGQHVVTVDRPGSAQSVIRVGRASIARSSPDYLPLLVANTVLGGQFASRLNLSLREEKGLTYGARSSLTLRRAGGAFTAGAAVQSSGTREAVEEFLTQIASLSDGKPITQEELDYAKAYLIRRFPARFETSGGILSHLAQLALYDLPDDYYSHYVTGIRELTLATVDEVIRRHLRLEGTRVVVVGDPEQTGDLADAVGAIMNGATS